MKPKISAQCACEGVNVNALCDLCLCVFVCEILSQHSVQCSSESRIPVWQ